MFRPEIKARHILIHFSKMERQSSFSFLSKPFAACHRNSPTSLRVKRVPEIVMEKARGFRRRLGYWSYRRRGPSASTRIHLFYFFRPILSHSFVSNDTTVRQWRLCKMRLHYSRKCLWENALIRLSRGKLEANRPNDITISNSSPSRTTRRQRNRLNSMEIPIVILSLTTRADRPAIRTAEAFSRRRIPYQSYSSPNAA